MSEEAKDTKEPTAEGAAGQAAAAAKPKPALPIALIAVVVLALGAGTALGSLLVAPRLIHARQAAAAAELADPHHKQDKKKAKQKEKKEKKGEAGKSPVYKIDNIIVNPADSQGQRFLMCTVAIESDDSKALDTLREHEIELRDKVVTMLSRQTMDRLTSQNSRDSLRTELLKVVQPVLGEDAADTELKIYLPQFVVQ